ncbi:hypothetical protein L1987_14678 [Smallanthus sonchifolius]|uniref:Uncharacterized protein n=1 Tax=Smallanthus sonchifolius TaxID=185202 RepID=A0ACB9J5P7_9ASTR|nr:hypothetical protein L1987_14678 [Smallanthus sonchifolius]
MREEWISILISQGEDADYLEKLSNKEIYRAFMGQQGEVANKKRAEEEEKARQKSRRAIAFNKRTHEERKVMMEFLKARGESGKRLCPMNFMNLQDLYRQVKKEEEERLKKTNLLKRADTSTEERKSKKPKYKPLVSPPSVQQVPSYTARLPSSTPKESKSSHPAPSHQQPPKKKIKPSTISEDSSMIVQWIYSDPDQWFEVFRGEKILELGEAHKSENESGRHLLLIIKHYFNPSKDVLIDAKPLQSHFPLVKWSYNAAKDEYTLEDVKGYKMRCSSKAIFSMLRRDIKSLSEIPFDNPSKDPRGYETAMILLFAADQQLCCGYALSAEVQRLLMIVFSAASNIDAADRQIIRNLDFTTDISSATLTHLLAEGMLLV